jgi:hypothetical protein
MNPLAKRLAKAPLYPEMSRRSLELQYHWICAALSHAALVVQHGDTIAAAAQVEAWMNESLDMATKAGVVRMLRNRSVKPAKETIH